MTKGQEQILMADLAVSIVKFETWKNEDNQSVCAITIGGIEKVTTYALDGQEEKVLQEMVVNYWSIWKSVGLN
jgi:hypothetical protein